MQDGCHMYALRTYFYILLYVSILDVCTDFTQRKCIKSEKPAIAYGDVYESRAIASAHFCFKR